MFAYAICSAELRHYWEIICNFTHFCPFST